MWWQFLLLIIVSWSLLALDFSAANAAVERPEVFRIIYFHFPMAITTV
jgi:hypothetical protein